MLHTARELVMGRDALKSAMDDQPNVQDTRAEHASNALESIALEQKVAKNRRESILEHDLI